MASNLPLRISAILFLEAPLHVKIRGTLCLETHLHQKIRNQIELIVRVETCLDKYDYDDDPGYFYDYDYGPDYECD